MPKPTSSAQNYYSITPLDNTIKHKKSPIIQPFYGDPKNFDQFLAKINRAFLLAPQRFASNIYHVVYICQYLEGNTVSWVEPILTGKDLELQEDWGKFFMAF